MNNNNHQNSDCSFAAEIVSYIYGEIGAKEKSVFEAHLVDCETCPEELADFMEIRFSVNDWKQTEFAPLATPVIEIPYEKEQAREIAAVSGSWWSNLRQIFTLSPAWMTATTAVAALVICFGLFAAVYKNSGSQEMVAGNGGNTQIKPTVLPTAEVSPNKPAEKIIVSDENSNSSGEITEPSKIVDQTPKTVGAGNNEATVVKVTERKPKNVTQNTAHKPVNNAANNSNKPVRKNPPVNNRQMPKLDNFDEDEDDSLRLAELFEDIETLE